MGEIIIIRPKDLLNSTMVKIDFASTNKIKSVKILN